MLKVEHYPYIALALSLILFLATMVYVGAVSLEIRGYKEDLARCNCSAFCAGKVVAAPVLEGGNWSVAVSSGAATGLN